jgi:prepilin-type processing-associated H-X9-DG protein
MKKSSLNQLATAPRQTGGVGAFTFTELLVVMGVVFVMGTVLLSASFTTREAVWRAECASNLRQIGVGVNLYSTEANGYLPQLNWPNGQFPWQTDELARTLPGSSTITRGPMGLGILWTIKILPNPRVFYCPSLAQANNQYSYGWYTWNGNPWPTGPQNNTGGGGQPGTPPPGYVHSAYNYYPQQKTLERVPGLYVLPVLSWNCAGFANNLNSVVFVSPNSSDNPEGAIIEPCPIKITDTDQTKMMAVDVLMLLKNIAHQNSGQPAGVNALFPDGHVKFQPVNGNQGINQAFNTTIWNAPFGGVLGNDSPPYPNWRRVVSYFQP